MAQNNGSGNKFDKAVARATHGEGGDHPTIPVKFSEDFITKNVGDAAIQAIINDQQLETAPQLYKMEQGDMVVGILEGNGAEAEFERIDQGVVTTNIVQSWIIASPDGRKRISILSSAQLDRKLPPFVGGLVKIVRGKDIDTKGGQRVTDYLVAGPKMPSGQTRNWSTKPVLEAGVNAEQRALPEGSASTSDPAHAAS